MHTSMKYSAQVQKWDHSEGRNKYIISLRIKYTQIEKKHQDLQKAFAYFSL